MTQEDKNIDRIAEAERSIVAAICKRIFFCYYFADRKTREATETDDKTEKLRKTTKETLEQNFTPSLARRLSRQFIEQTRQSLPRSPSIPREKLYRSSTEERANEPETHRPYGATTLSDRTEYRSRSCDRGPVRRTNSLLDNNERVERFEQRSPRRSVSLFDDEDEDEDSLGLMGSSSLARQVMTLGRKYRDPTKSSLANFHNYRTEKIQEEPHDEFSTQTKAEALPENNNEACCNGNTTNNTNAAPSDTARSCETSPTESSSTFGDSTPSTAYKQDSSRDFESRLLAAENLIKESKARNLGTGKYDRNLTSSYKDTDKCDKELLSSISDVSGNFSKRRSCIPSLRLRSGSLSREASAPCERRNTLSCAKETSHSGTPERSILSKFFRAGSSNGSVKSENGTKEKSPKSKEPRRISRFLRPDFFDTPREESQYVKDKEAQKAAENERRKSRFMRKKSETKSIPATLDEENKQQTSSEEKPEKELKNEANAMTRDKTDVAPYDNKIDNEQSTNSSTSETKIEKQASKNSFLHSLEKKLEKFRSNDDTAKLANGNVPVADQRDQPNRENTAPPIVSTEDTLTLAKSSTSVDDLTLAELNASTSKSRVSSVLGLFKNDSAKTSANGQRSQSTILSKFKKNPYKGSRSDGVLSLEQTSSSIINGSKIPTKFTKPDAKSKKIVADGRKMSDPTAETKKSPSKEKSPPERSGLRKTMETQLKITKKASPEKSIDGKSDKPEKSTSAKDEFTRKNSSPDKSDNKLSLARLPTRKLSSEKVADNKQLEAKNNETSDDKKIIVKAKKNVKSLSSLVKNGSVAKLESRDKAEEPDKRIKKVVKTKDAADKDPTDGTKKKKIVRVVKKVGKNSDSSDSKSDEKEPPKKTLMKKITSAAKKDASPDHASAKKIKDKSPEIAMKKIKENSPENSSKTKDKSPEKLSKVKDKIPETKLSAIVAKTGDAKSTVNVPNTSTIPSSQLSNSPKIDCESSTEVAALPSNLFSTEEPESKSDALDNARGKDPDATSSATMGAAKTNKTSLKLDLTKIPQHAFKVNAPTKKDSTKPEVLNSKSVASTTKSMPVDTPKMDEVEARLLENLSRMTHHANITGNKITIEKPLRAKENESLQCELISPEIPKNLESMPDLVKSEVPKENKSLDAEEIDKYPNATTRPTTLSLESKNSHSPLLSRDISSDHTEEMFSPLDDAESFDSWSICSADLNHHRHDLNSPTSPTYSPMTRGDHPESIIDRIRRKSFYSRFNERKRKSSLNAPPPGITLPTCSTLPRKFSFNSTRDKRQEYAKPNIYGGSSRRNPERSYSLYNEETTLPRYRKSSVDRDRHYSDSIGNVASSSGDSKSPNDQYGSLGSCYDPLRRYRVTPSPESLNSHRKYQSTDYGLDDDNGPYRSPMSPSFHNDSSLESYSSRSSLPRKYGSVSSCPETKTADYYEELLTPSRSDYFTSRKIPTPGDYQPRHENGYHNGNLDLRQTENDKWKNYSERIEGLDRIDASDGRHDKSARCNAEKNESQDLPISSEQLDAKVSNAE